ncbi:MAG: NUDIX hydrolase [Coriobacteriia bacterium]|nr:NUDIX hydrolase [Coriobacteriia bacterium]
MSDTPEASEAPETPETRIISRTEAYQGAFLTLESVELELPNGHRTTHDVVRHPGAVAVLALDADGHVLMVKQYRTAFDREMLEIPAGKLEPGEDPLSCARRELEEETGFVAGELRHLVSIAIAVGYCDELLHLFLATNLNSGSAQPDTDEFVEVVWVPLADLVQAVQAGELKDAKSIVAVLLAQHEQLAKA